MPCRALAVAVAALLCACGAPGHSDTITFGLGWELAAAADRAPSQGAAELVTIPGFTSFVESGNPALPCRTIYVALPPDADETTVEISHPHLDTAILPGSYEIPPAPPVSAAGVESWGYGKRIRDGRNTLVYDRSAFYPDQHLRIRNIGHLRTWKVAEVEFWPYCWNPVTRQLRKLNVSSARLNFQRNASTARAGTDDRASKMSGFVSNRSEALGWYSTSSEPLAGGSTANDYVIVTTNSIANSSVQLSSFADFQAIRGHSVMIVTEDEWGGGAGDDAADNLRDWLLDNYISLRIEYVLLIGNPDPYVGEVPMKMLWPRRSEATYKEAPSDYYYAALTGDWDLDNDGFAGECPDDLGPGGIDRIPEVYVGRIPFYGSIEDLDVILQKTMDYETTALGNWSRRFLMPMCRLDPATPSYQFGEDMKRDIAAPLGFNALRIYESDYDLAPPPEHYPCDYDTVQSQWQNGAGLVFWMTHGEASVATGVFTSDRCGYLDDSRPSIVYQASCSNGKPEVSNNLGYSLLRQGAIATVSASRVSWYYIGQTDFTSSDSIGGIGYQYASQLLSDQKSCGRAFADARIAVPMTIWANHVVFNLYGDPSAAFDQSVANSLSGTVRRTDGVPIGGAEIRTADGSVSAFSRADGFYLLTDLDPAGEDIVVSSPGFYPQRFYSVPVSAESAVHLDFYLVSAVTGAVGGLVTDAYGTPLFDAQVAIPEADRSTYTGHDGSYLFDDLLPGHYTLIASKEGYSQKAVYDCEVLEAQTSQINIALPTRTANLIRNGWFEEEFTNGTAAFWPFYSDPAWQPVPLMGIDFAKHGDYSQKLHLPQPDFESHAGFRQTVPVFPGKTYSLVCWQRSHFGGEESNPSENVVGSVGYDPAGGTDPNAPAVVWSGFPYDHDAWYSSFQHIVPLSSQVTVFLDGCRKMPGGGDDCDVWFDSVSLSGPAPAPPVPVVEVDAVYQTDHTSIGAQWSCSDTDVIAYECAVSTTCDESGIVQGGGWVNVGLDTSVIRTGLQLQNGDPARVLVRAYNVFGVVGCIGASPAVRVVDSVAGIAEAKQMPDGTWVYLANTRVSRMGEGAEFFVQDAMRSAGISVCGDQFSVPYLLSGTRAAVVGRLDTEDGSRLVADAFVMPSSQHEPVRPLAMPNVYVAGADYHYSAGPPVIGQQGSAESCGANNVGLLVTCWGRVIDISGNEFAIDDGSLVGGLGIQCRNSVTLPPAGSFVRVTGIADPAGLCVYRSDDIVQVVE